MGQVNKDIRTSVPWDRCCSKLQATAWTELTLSYFPGEENGGMEHLVAWRRGRSSTQCDDWCSRKYSDENANLRRLCTIGLQHRMFSEGENDRMKNRRMVARVQGGGCQEAGERDYNMKGQRE